MSEPTWQEITAEAIRRKAQGLKDGRGDIELEALIVEITREGWKPPPAVDPDLLAFREWLANDPEADAWTGGALLCRLGRHDSSEEARAFLAGARMAREKERERAKVLVEFIGRVRPGVFNNLDHANHEARKVLAKYRGEA